MAQYGRPSSDITALSGSGSGTFTALDEITFSDSDYISSNDNTNVTYEGLLSSVTDPASASTHIVRWRQAQADGNVAPSSGGTSSSYSAYLYQGGTLIATLVSGETSNASSFLAKSYTLTSTEANSITNYADLRIRFDFTGGGGAPANRRGVAISWVEFEVPDAPATNYTTSYLKGSFVESGKDTGLLKGAYVTALKGSYAETGQTVSFYKGYNLNANKGSFVESGKDVDIIYIRAFNLAANTGSFLETGNSSSLLKDSYQEVDKGSFIFSGKDATLSHVLSRTLSALKGSFVLSGKEVTLTKINVYSLSADIGSFLLEGKDANLTTIVQYTLDAQTGTFNLINNDGNLLKGSILAVSNGSFLLDGKIMDAFKSYTLIGNKSSGTLTGKDVDFDWLRNYILSANKELINVYGRNTNFLIDEILTVLTDADFIDKKFVPFYKNEESLLSPEHNCYLAIGTYTNINGREKELLLGIHYYLGNGNMKIKKYYNDKKIFGEYLFIGNVLTVEELSTVLSTLDYDIKELDLTKLNDYA
jgi:hypothetical protein